MSTRSPSPTASPSAVGDRGVVVELGTLIGVAVLGLVISRRRAHKDRRRLELMAGQGSVLLPEGEFAVWRLRWGVADLRPSRVTVRPGALGSVGSVAYTAPRSLQPAWQLAASAVRLEVLPKSRWVDVTRVRLTPAAGRTLTLRVSRELRRPRGHLDAPYERRLEGYLGTFIDTLRRAGAVQGRA